MRQRSETGERREDQTRNIFKVGLLIPEFTPENEIDQTLLRFQTNQHWVQLEIIKVQVTPGDSLRNLEAVCQLISAGVSGILALRPGSAFPVLQSIGEKNVIFFILDLEKFLSFHKFLQGLLASFRGIVHAIRGIPDLQRYLINL